MVTNIKKLIEELKSYHYPDKEKLLALRIEERLDKSLKEYYNQLNKTLDKLTIYDEEHENLTVMKKINKEVK